MATELAKLVVRKALKVRTTYVPLAKETLKKTKYELFLLGAVSLHEFTYWKINKKEKDLLTKIKNLEILRIKMKQDKLLDIND